MAIDYKEDFLFKIPLLGAVLAWLASNDIDYGDIVFIICVLLLVSLFWFTDISFWQIFVITVLLAPIWLTYFVFRYLFFGAWMLYVGKLFALKTGRVTLRVRLPAEVQKSPEAMEFVISQIHNLASPDNLMQTYLDGKRPLPFSFELVSIGGEVRFYVNLPKSKTKAAFEANMYAQYPGVEIIEEPVDYTAEIPLGGGERWATMSFHMGKKGKDYLPIKTYLDFHHDRMPKEEEKVDPITPMLELLGNIQPYERLYVQMIMTPVRSDDYVKGSTEAIAEIMGRDPTTGKARVRDEEEERTHLTTGERDMVAAMERNASKYVYKGAIRWMYIVEQGKFNGDVISPILRSFSQYDMIGRNQIGPRWRTDTNYKDIFIWQKKEIVARKKKEHFEYKTRSYYNKSRSDLATYWTVEELATMFHLPGRVALTPNLGRVESTRGSAPSNLPVGNLPTSNLPI